MKISQKIISLCAAAVSLTSSMAITASAATYNTKPQISVKSTSTNAIRVNIDNFSKYNSNCTFYLKAWPVKPNKNKLLNSAIYKATSYNTAKNNANSVRVTGLQPGKIYKLQLVVKVNGSNVASSDGELYSNTKLFTGNRTVSKFRIISGQNTRGDNSPCVPASLTMMINQRNKNYNLILDNVLDSAYYNNYKTQNTGLELKDVPAIAALYGYRGTKTLSVRSSYLFNYYQLLIDQALLDDHTVMIGGKYHFYDNKSESHAAVIYGKTAAGNYIIGDPYDGSQRIWNGTLSTNRNINGKIYNPKGFYIKTIDEIYFLDRAKTINNYMSNIIKI